MPERRWRRVVPVAAVLVLAAGACTRGGDPPAPPPTAGSSTPGSATLTLDALRAGGLVIVFRHAATDQSRPDREPVDLADCATQRNLSDGGRADARAIGTAFRDLAVPVGAVWASPYCRARDTAQLAFGRGEVIPGLERLYPDRDEAADRRTSDLIRRHAPAAGRPNLVIAAHGVYPSVLSPPVTLAEGEAAVYSVTGEQVRLLGRVLPRHWASLAATPTEQATADRVLDSVVTVHAGNGRPGTGFRVAVPGLVVTAASVVAGGDAARVVLRDGSQRTARVLAVPPGTTSPPSASTTPAFPHSTREPGSSTPGVATRCCRRVTGRCGRSSPRWRPKSYESTRPSPRRRSARRW